jgi:hypothetical protein
MLCLQQCIDMCDLSPEEVSALAGRVSLADIAAAQAACPRRGTVADDAPGEDALACVLLDEVRSAEEPSELQRVARRYRAFALARAAERP